MLFSSKEDIHKWCSIQLSTAISGRGGQIMYIEKSKWSSSQTDCVRKTGLYNLISMHSPNGSIFGPVLHDGGLEDEWGELCLWLPSQMWRYLTPEHDQ